MQSLLDARFNELSSRTVGELKAAREATDAAVKQCYTVLNSMQVLVPSEGLTTLCNKLKAIEAYAKQYYLRDSGSSQEEDDPTPVNPDGGGDNPQPQPDDGGDGGDGEVTPVQPE